jgi:hypothetical protein
VSSNSSTDKRERKEEEEGEGKRGREGEREREKEEKTREKKRREEIILWVLCNHKGPCQSKKQCNEGSRVGCVLRMEDRAKGKEYKSPLEA